MRIRSLLLSTAFISIAGLALASTPPSSPPAERADDDATVTFTGWLQANDYTLGDVVVTANVNGELLVTGVKENGRFDLVLPSGTSATLRFEKPGHLPKEVTIDTHNSTVGEPGSSERHVEFAVVLEPERWMGGLSYAGPVGSIGFDAQGGCLAVEHDKQMVLGRKQRHVTMTF